MEKHLQNNSPTNDYRHKANIPVQMAVPVESYIAPCDFEMNGHTVVKGSWVMATKINDDNLWKEVVEKGINGYSIKGKGKRNPVAFPREQT